MSLFIIDDIPKRQLHKRWKLHAKRTASRAANPHGHGYRFRSDLITVYQIAAVIEKQVVRAL